MKLSSSLLALAFLPLLACTSAVDTPVSAPEPSATREGPVAPSYRATGPAIVFDGNGKSVALPESGELTIGRSKSSDIWIPEGAVSRQHAKLAKGSSGYVLTDLKSVNGTSVNGEQIDEAWLNDGDKIQIGQTLLVVHLP